MPLDDLASLSDALAALTAKAAARVVAVHRGRGGISGILWRTGLVVTAHEALEGEDDLELILPDGSRTKAELIGRDPSTDVALLKATTPEAGEWTAAAIPAAGSLAVVVGRGENGPIMSYGPVAESGPKWRSMRGGEIDARLMLGLRFSARAEGGAVVAPDGGLIGLAVTGPRRRAIVIPAATVARAAATLSEKGYVPHAYLGVGLHPTDDASGVIVVSVVADGPAAKAGLAVGDVITTWSGDAVRAVGDVYQRLHTGNVGQTAKLGVLRGGAARDIDVVLGERPRR
jgi:S1-C subfamily serine protease